MVEVRGRLCLYVCVCCVLCVTGVYHQGFAQAPTAATSVVGLVQRHARRVAASCGQHETPPALNPPGRDPPGLDIPAFAWYWYAPTRSCLRGCWASTKMIQTPCPTVRSMLPLWGCCLRSRLRLTQCDRLRRHPTAKPICPTCSNPQLFARLLGIDHVMDTVVGNELLKGISGGQKRRVTVGEMAVGLAQVMCLVRRGGRGLGNEPGASQGQRC